MIYNVKYISIYMIYNMYKYTFIYIYIHIYIYSDMPDMDDQWPLLVVHSRHVATKLLC